jgi:hypothetical protein
MILAATIPRPSKHKQKSAATVIITASSGDISNRPTLIAIGGMRQL